MGINQEKRLLLYLVTNKKSDEFENLRTYALTNFQKSALHSME